MFKTTNFSNFVTFISAATFQPFFHPWPLLWLLIFHGQNFFKTATFLKSGRDDGHLATLVLEGGGRGLLPVRKGPFMNFSFDEDFLMTIFNFTGNMTF